MSVLRAVARRAIAALAWPVRTPRRLLALAWLVGLLVVGSANPAMAADDFITGPDLGESGGQTLFERHGAEAYGYPVDTDSDHDGAGDSQLWNLVNAATTLVTWFGLTLLRGALVALQWMLDLDLYGEQAGAVDDAVGQLNTSVFLPLVGVTLVIGAASVYLRARREGGGTVVNDLVWLLAAAILAFTLMAQPSRVVTVVNDARAALSEAMMTTYSSAAGGSDSSTGAPAVDTGTTSDGAIRAVTDSLWNVYGVSGWCYVAWGSVDACQVVGQSYLDDPEAEAGDSPWGTAREALTDDGEVEPFGADTGWVRGQEPGRLGAALLLAVVSIAAALMLLTMVVFGLLAAIGVIILLLLGAIFLAAWMIPGRPRAIGVRWLEALIGAFLQSLIITTIVGGVMVVGAIFNAATATYGIFMVALLNLTALLLGLRFRSQFESVLGLGTTATGSSVVSSYTAARMISGGARMGARMTGGALSAAGRLAGAGAVAAAPFAAGAVNGARTTVGLATGRVRPRTFAPLRPGAAPYAAAGSGGAPSPAAGGSAPPGSSGAYPGSVPTAAPRTSGPAGRVPAPPATPVPSRPAQPIPPGIAAPVAPAPAPVSRPGPATRPSSRPTVQPTVRPAARQARPAVPPLPTAPSAPAPAAAPARPWPTPAQPPTRTSAPGRTPAPVRTPAPAVPRLPTRLTPPATTGGGRAAVPARALAGRSAGARSLPDGVTGAVPADTSRTVRSPGSPGGARAARRHRRLAPLSAPRRP